VERLRKAGADVQITEYAGAYHQFDRPDGGPPRSSPGDQNASRCFWEERPAGQLVSRSSGQAFGLNDPCVILGGTSGPDPAAYRDALQAVKALVRSPTDPVSRDGLITAARPRARAAAGR
jgi:dienelactone hydrolase